jgi:hypothetical protein
VVEFKNKTPGFALFVNDNKKALRVELPNLQLEFSDNCDIGRGKH